MKTPRQHEQTVIDLKTRLELARDDNFTLQEKYYDLTDQAERVHQKLTDNKEAIEHMMAELKRISPKDYEKLAELKKD